MSQVTLRPGNAGEILPIDLLRMAEPSMDELNSYMDTAISFIAEVEGAIIGVCMVTQVTPETIELKNVSVYPEFRSIGVGTSLISYAADMAREAGCMEIIAGVDNSNTSGFIFLQKLGFDLDSIEKGYYTQNGKIIPGSFNLNAVDRIWFLRHLD